MKRCKAFCKHFRKLQNHVKKVVISFLTRRTNEYLEKKKINKLLLLMIVIHTKVTVLVNIILVLPLILFYWIEQEMLINIKQKKN